MYVLYMYIYCVHTYTSQITTIFSIFWIKLAQGSFQDRMIIFLLALISIWKCIFRFYWRTCQFMSNIFLHSFLCNNTPQDFHIIDKTRVLELRGSGTLADIVAYRGSVRCDKECPRVYWIMGNLHIKNEGSKSRDQKVISL